MFPVSARCHHLHLVKSLVVPEESTGQCHNIGLNGGEMAVYAADSTVLV